MREKLLQLALLVLIYQEDLLLILTSLLISDDLNATIGENMKNLGFIELCFEQIGLIQNLFFYLHFLAHRKRVIEAVLNLLDFFVIIHTTKQVLLILLFFHTDRVRIENAEIDRIPIVPLLLLLEVENPASRLRLIFLDQREILESDMQVVEGLVLLEKVRGVPFVEVEVLQVLDIVESIFDGILVEGAFLPQTVLAEKTSILNFCDILNNLL